MEKKKQSVFLVFIFVFLIVMLMPAGGYCQEEGEQSLSYLKAVALAERLSPEEKVGQLFLITFDGLEISPESDVYQLITDYNIGGVVLRSENNNFSDVNAGQKTFELISGLQSIDWADQKDLPVSPELSYFNGYIPLFIGISQPGGMYPYDQMINGITSVPSQMAVGATWDPANAEEIGKLVGNQLEPMGFNLFFGPSIDVLDITYGKGEENLGVRTFGGDPYWVGEMGAAYISGIHQGSNNRITVIAKNFPGRGSSDRLPEEEVATVRKSLEQLKLIELAPFFKVTDLENPDPLAISDGLLNTHIRYQGFQGNIRATTKPITFDQNAVELLMNLPQLESWRSNGGLLISDDLGSKAVYKFFNPNNEFIDARQVARNAFLAGNDLLYMDQLKSTGDEDRFSTYRKTIELFVQKYIEDQAFSERVDESVIRILKKKFDLYDEFIIEKVNPNVNYLKKLSEDPEIIFQVAQQAATLINPSQSQVAESIPAPPQFGERIIIFTDEQLVVQCDGCTQQGVFPVNGLQSSILDLYGPNGSGQISENQIVSYSFDELNDYVFNPFNRPEIEENLSQAKWVIFSLREIESGQDSSFALHNLLIENPTILRDKNIFVFSFDVPYYFDATEISAFSAFYCLYSKLPSFVDLAARIIFQEINPQGSSPVSIPGIAYDLIEVTTPAPEQIISLFVDEEAARINIENQETENTNGELEPEHPVFKLGDSLPVMTGLIVDHNNNPVPNGTVVRFSMNVQGENTTIQQIEAVTEKGIARASFDLQGAGLHEIKVTSEPALSSQILVLDISEEETLVSAIIPTPAPTKEDPIGSTEPVEVPEEIEEIHPNNKSAEWFIATCFSWVLGIALFSLLKNYFVYAERARISGFSVLGGLFNTAWYIFDFPGSPMRYGIEGYVQLCFAVFVGSIIGGAVGWALIRIIRYSSENQ